MVTTKQYSDGYWNSADGLRLHYRDYAGRDDRPPIICIPGLTRNARDFADVAERLAGNWRVICVDLRGRGESEHAKDSATYTPPTYVGDVALLIATLALPRFILFGTSLGGIVSMGLAAMSSASIAGVLLNDIAPEIETAGLDRIKGYVGRNLSWPTWVHAARTLAETNATVYPDYKLTDWLGMAKQLYRLTSGGRIIPAYDLKIADPFKLPAPPMDLWPFYAALSETPVLILKGALSDLISEKAAKEMVKRSKNAQLVIVPRVGHAPTLSEPKAIAAIDAFLAGLSK